MFQIERLTGAHLDALYSDPTADERLQNLVRLKWGIGFAAVDNGYVLGAGGIVRVFERTGYAWTRLTADIIAEHKKSMHRAVKIFFPLAARLKGVDTVWAVPEGGIARNCAWLLRLGFTEENGLYRWNLYRS